jgi:predicted nuclease of predicted toxin-antitoxin system
MRFLADESCDFAVVRALRAAGHEVVTVAEVARGAGDGRVIGLATETGSILLTEDKDFGQLVFASGQGKSGVVLFRFPGAARRQLQVAAVDLVQQFGERLVTSFVVVEPGRVRIGPLPRSGDAE